MADHRFDSYLSYSTTTIVNGANTTVVTLSSWDFNSFNPAVVSTTTLDAFSDTRVSDLTDYAAPALTTTFTPIYDDCTDNWFRHDVIGFYSYGTGPAPTSQAIVQSAVWSTRPQTTDPLYGNYIGCQPYGQLNFSPGICPHAHTIEAVTAIHLILTEGGTRTIWLGHCCRTYVYRKSIPRQS